MDLARDTWAWAWAWISWGAEAGWEWAWAQPVVGQTLGALATAFIALLLLAKAGK